MRLQSVRSRMWRMLVLSVALLLAVACAKGKALQEVEDLNRALGQAKDSCASAYAPDSLADVQDEVDAVNGLADDKKWRRALNDAQSAKPRVETVRSEAETARSSARQSAEQAMATAEASLKEAEQAEAASLASSDYEAAKGRLDDARRLMENPCKYNEARAAADDAAQKARLARNAALAEKKRREEEAKRLAEEEARRRAEEEARRRAEEEARKRAAAYTVERGDYLWKISGMEKIYSAHKFWPIIYDANRANITDPDLIYPGQELRIPREVPDEEMMSKLRVMWSKAARGEPL